MGSEKMAFVKWETLSPVLIQTTEIIVYQNVVVYCKLLYGPVDVFFVLL